MFTYKPEKKKNMSKLEKSWFSKFLYEVYVQPFLDKDIVPVIVVYSSTIIGVWILLGLIVTFFEMVFSFAS